MLGLIGYEEPYRAALVALSAREHMMFVGGPGLAKSQFVRAMFGQVDNVKVWEVQLSKFADDTRIFGIPKIRELVESAQVKYADHIPSLEADLWFIDEFWDAPDVLLRDTLSLMNERVFLKEATPRPIKLHSCIATANYTRENQLTAAVADRFVITVNAPRLGEKDRLKLYDETSFKVKESQRFTLQDFHNVEKRAANVKIPAQIVKALVEMCGNGANRFNFSPRRERKLAKLLRVYAAIQKKTEVTPDCLEPFKWALPLNVEEKDRITAHKDLLGLVGAFDHVADQKRVLDEAAKLLDTRTDESMRSVAGSIRAIMRAPANEQTRRDAEALMNDASMAFGDSFADYYSSLE